MTALPLAPTTRFPSPEGTTAVGPPESRGIPRDGVRLLVARPDRLDDVHFRDIGRFLRRGDVLVVNTSATVAGEVDAWSPRHGDLVVHLATPLDGGRRRSRGRELGRRAAECAGGRVPGPGRPARRAGAPRRRSRRHVGRRLPRAGVVPDGARQPVVARVGHRGPGRPDSARRPSDRLRVPRPPLPAARLPDGLLPRSGKRRDAQRRAAVHQPARHPAGPVGRSRARRSSSTRASRPRTPASHRSRSGSRSPLTRRRWSTPPGPGTAGWWRSGPPRPARSSPRPGSTAWSRRPAAGPTCVIGPDRPVRVVDGLVTGWHNPEASHLLLVEAVAGAELTQKRLRRGRRAGVCVARVRRLVPHPAGLRPPQPAVRRRRESRSSTPPATRSTAAPPTSRPTGIPVSGKRWPPAEQRPPLGLSPPV